MRVTTRKVEIIEADQNNILNYNSLSGIIPDALIQMVGSFDCGVAPLFSLENFDLFKTKHVHKNLYHMLGGPVYDMFGSSLRHNNVVSSSQWIFCCTKVVVSVVCNKIWKDIFKQLVVVNNKLLIIRPLFQVLKFLKAWFLSFCNVALML